MHKSAKTLAIIQNMIYQNRKREKCILIGVLTGVKSLMWV